MIAAETLDSQILLRLQQGIPLVWKPYAQLAREFGITEADMLARITRFRSEGKIRRIGAVFNVSQLGYRSALCGIAVPSENLAHIADILHPHSGITHCYSRSVREDRDVAPLVGDDGVFVPNLWFTLSTPNELFDGEVAQLQAKIPYPIRIAPATRKFKVQVILDPQHANPKMHALSQESEIPSIGSKPISTTIQEQTLIALLHQDLPDQSEPFAQIATQSKWNPEDLLERLSFWQSTGALRRIAVLVRHQKLGFSANAMCTWKIPSQDVDRAGTMLASHREVTHCYEREPFLGFPYNVFAMVHAGSEEALHTVIQSLCREIGYQPGLVFYSVTEFKKSSLVPFAQSEHH